MSVQQLPVDKTFAAKIAPVQISSPYDKAAHPVLPLRSCSIRPHSVFNNQYFILTHLQQTEQTGGGRPMTVYKLCQLLPRVVKGKLQYFVGVVCTIQRLTCYQLSAAIAIDEREGLLYLAYARAPETDTDKQTHNVDVDMSLKAKHVVIELMPFSFKPNDQHSDMAQIQVHKSSSVVWTCAKESRFPIRLCFTPKTNRLMLIANKRSDTIGAPHFFIGASVLTPDAEIYQIEGLPSQKTDQTPESPVFTLKSVEMPSASVTSNEFRRLELDYSVSACVFSESGDRMFLFSSATLPPEKAPEHLAESDMPFLMQYEIDDKGDLRLLSCDCAQVKAACEYLMLHLSTLLAHSEQPQITSSHLASLRASIYLVGSYSDRLLFGFKHMPNIMVILSHDQHIKAAQILGAIELRNYMSGSAAPDQERFNHNFLWLHDRDRCVYLQSFPQSTQLAGALLARSLKLEI